MASKLSTDERLSQYWCALNQEHPSHQPLENLIRITQITFYQCSSVQVFSADWRNKKHFSISHAPPPSHLWYSLIASEVLLFKCIVIQDVTLMWNLPQQHAIAAANKRTSRKWVSHNTVHSCHVPAHRYHITHDTLYFEFFLKNTSCVPNFYCDVYCISISTQFAMQLDNKQLFLNTNVFKLIPQC